MSLAAPRPAADDVVPGPERPERPEPPGPPAPRLRGIDVARGLAVLGMVAAHVTSSPELAWADPASWLSVVHGRSSILFATLAGVSIALVTGRREPLAGDRLVEARTRLLVRAALLFAIGGALDLLDTGIAVILEVYALLFVATLPFLRWRPRRLFTLAAAVAVVAPLAVHALIPLWETSPSTLGWLLVTGTYPALTWSAFVLAGLGVGRLALGDPAVLRRLVAAGAALALLGYGTAWLLGGVAADAAPAASTSASSGPTAGDDVDVAGLDCYPSDDGTVYCEPPEGPADPGPADALRDVSLLLTAEPHSGSTFEVAGSGGVALAVVGACLLLARARRGAGRVLGAALAPLAAVGSMALTAYCAHVVAYGLTPESLWESDPSGLRIFAATAVGLLLACTLWARLRGRGPLERLVSWTARRTSTPPRDAPAAPAAAGRQADRAGPGGPPTVGA